MGCKMWSGLAAAGEYADKGSSVQKIRCFILYSFCVFFLFSKYFSCTFLGKYIYIYVCVFALLSPVFNFYSSPEYEGNTILRDIENYVFTSLYGVKSDKIHHNYHQNNNNIIVINKS